MQIVLDAATPAPRVDPAELFRKLGLHPADERPILQAFREANAQRRIEHLRRSEAHQQRVRDHLRRFSRPLVKSTSLESRQGKRRAVWCVELQRCFRSLCEAARFAHRSASNISYALRGGGKCGMYHWETYDPTQHQ